MPEPAVRVDHQAVGRNVVQRAPDPGGDQFGRLHLGALDVDHAQAQPLVPPVLLDQPQVVQALAGEFEDDLVHARRVYRGEQEVVVALPGRPRVPVAVAHVQGPGDRHAVGHDVHRLDRQLDLFRVPGQERLVDLQQVGAGCGQLPRLGVEPAGQRPDQVARFGVGLVTDPPGQRERPGEGELDRPVGELAGKPEILGQAEPGAGPGQLRQRPADLGLVVVEVVGLAALRDLHAGNPGQEVVHVVISAQLAVGHDVDAGQLLILDRRLDGHLVDLGEVLRADPPLVVLGLQPLQPFRHGVGTNHGGRQQDGVLLLRRHGDQSLACAVSVVMLDPGRWRNGVNSTPKPRRLATSCSSGPFTQLTTEPSYLPGP